MTAAQRDGARGPLRTRLRRLAARVWRDAVAVYFIARDPRAPLAVRGLALLVAAYALSPIDLVPDFIPVVGLLDDLVLVPLGVAAVVRLTPPAVLDNARRRAAATLERPVSRMAAVVIVMLWALLCWGVYRWVAGRVSA